MRFAIALLLLLATAPLAPVAAQRPAAARPSSATASPLVITAANRTAAADAERGRRRADDKVRAGDVVRYALVFTNRQASRVKDVVIHNPIPAQLRYVAGSARASRPDARLEFSTDNGRSWSARPMETVLEDGRQVQRPVAPDRYTDVRWVVTGWIEPRASLTAEYEARLPDGSVSTPPQPAPQRDGGR